VPSRLAAFDSEVRARLGRPAGIDEVGRGPLAGPLVACCAVLHPDAALPGVDDSKLIPPRERGRLDAMIRRECAGLGLGVVQPLEIDTLGMGRCIRLAFERAVADCTAPADVYLVDGEPVHPLAFRAEFVVRGDSRSLSIASASIVAKVYRDGLMCAADDEWPGYGFARNSGYGTPEHLRAIASLGPCPIHRLSFGPLRSRDLFGV
jgi:ribonuclease HII